MSRIRIVVAAAVTAAAVAAAPAAQADPLDEVVEKVRCAGDALAGNACHG